MSTDTPIRELTRTTSPLSAARRRGRVGRRRNMPAILGGTALILTSAVAGSWLFASLSKTTEVLVAAKPITEGKIIEPGDLRIGEISGGGVSAMAASRQPDVVGKPAAVTIPEGTLLNKQLIANAAPPGPGMAAVGLALGPSRVPDIIEVGRLVNVLSVPNGKDIPTTGEKNQSSANEPTMLATSARVLSVRSEGGVTLVSVAVPLAQAGPVSLAAAQERVAVSVLPVER